MTNFPRYERYKDSGVEWLGEIPEHWELKKMKFLTQNISEKVHSGKYFLPYLGLENIESWTGKKLETESIVDGIANIFKPDDILFCKLRPYLAKVYLSKEDGICTTEFLVLRSSKFSQKYLFFLLLSKPFISLVNSSVYGSKMPRASWDFIGSQAFPIPPIAEQERIAEFLDRKCGEIDEAIAKKQRLIELLDEQKTILINQAVTKGLNPDAPMKDSAIDWLGQIPAHWETKKLKYLFREVDNRSENGSETLLSLRMCEGLVPHNDVSEKRIQAENLIGYKKIKKGQIVMNRMRAAIGLFGLASCSGLVSPDYAVFDPWKKLEEQYFLWLFKTDALKDTFRLESKGLGTGSSGFLRLYFDRFGMIKVPFPGVQEQKQIVAYIDTTSTAISKAVSRINKHIEIMKELKQILIAEAVTGKIKV
jgi:type I restriction enzyme S subunit